MKKRIITMLLLVVMVLSLSACGNKAVANTKPSDSNNTLVFLFPSHFLPQLQVFAF